jgi:hypothetical protein
VAGKQVLGFRGMTLLRTSYAMKLKFTMKDLYTYAETLLPCMMGTVADFERN